MLDLNATYTVDGVARAYRTVNFDGYRAVRNFSDPATGVSSSLTRDHSLSKNGRARHLQQLTEQVSVTRNGVTTLEPLTINITIDMPKDLAADEVVPFVNGACDIVTTEAELPRFLGLES